MGVEIQKRFYKTRTEADKRKTKEQVSGKYEMCYITHLTEEEKIDN